LYGIRARNIVLIIQNKKITILELNKNKKKNSI